MHIRQELLERAVQHRPAPHDRLVVVEEEADRHQLQPILHGRDDHLVDGDGLLVDPEDVRNRVAVDVRVENPRAPARLRERNCEVRRQRGLADAALAGGDRDHAAVPGQADDVVALRCAAAELRRQRLTLLGRHHRERERESPYAGNVGERLVDLFLEGVPQRAAGDRQHDRERDDAVLDLDVPDHVELRHGPLELGVDHLLERGEDRLAAWLHAPRVPVPVQRRRASRRRAAAPSGRGSSRTGAKRSP